MSDEKKTIGKTYNYAEYLQLNKVLDAQHVVSKAAGKPVHDEHLFIITHQAYELWFKQILFEIDSVRALFCHRGILNECHTLLVINRLNRVVLILKLLTEQFQILETMTPLDFLEFRGHLSTASGFQSLQFRLLENKLGIREDFRIKYNQQHYQRVFNDPASIEMLKDSIASPSLFQLVEGWLERTPGLNSKGFHFWKQYRRSVNEWIDTCLLKPAEAETDPERKESRYKDYNKQKETFDTIFDPEAHKVLVDRGDRRLSHVATQGALMISLYRDEPRFHQPFHLLTLLADIDSLMMKWRSNHVMMVQRMIGSKVGTGGSSGYQYLRSTVSDRYKVFLDLFNLSAYLVPRDYIPPLTSDMKRRLSIFSQEEVAEMEGNDVNDPASSDDESAQCDEVTDGLKKVSFSME